MTHGLASSSAAPSPRVPSWLVASVAVHAGAAAAAAALPGAWPWALGAVVANHACITGAGLWPRSSWLGSNWTRLPDAAAKRGEVAITIDDGPDPEVTPRVLDLLDAAGMQATFFCIASIAAGQAPLCREIVQRGHSVQNHSDRHAVTFSLAGPATMRAEIGNAQQRLADLTGVAPRYFRAPAGLRNVFLAPILDRLGLQLVSWTRRGFDTRETDPAKVLARLLRGLAAGDIVLLHDGNAARTSNGVPVVLEVLPALCRAVRDAGLQGVTLDAADADGETDRHRDDGLAEGRTDAASAGAASAPAASARAGVS